MRLIVTLDEHGGMLFNRRRQSRDRVLAENVLRMTEQARLVVSPYSAPLFASHPALVVAEDPLTAAEKGDFCFLEEQSPRGRMALFSRVVIYKWNRHYPADVFFDADLSEFSLIETEEFEGFSHKKITKEVYQRV